jgi:transposase-like protein
MRQRGLPVDHTTIYRSRAACTDPWRVDEASIKAKKVWTSLSRAVDSEGNAPSVSVESDT